MKYPVLLIVASIVVAFHLQDAAVNGFQFSLPGQWGGGGKKRGFTFSLPGQWGNGQNKRSPPFISFKQECQAADVDTLQTTYDFLRTEIERVAMCMEYLTTNMETGNKVGSKQPIE